MNFKLGVREITESDIKADCPFMPEKEDFPMHVAAFVEDIDNMRISAIPIGRFGLIRSPDPAVFLYL
ncbi:hypothetical protein [Vibrio tapetis]|uniref:Uncharacterized protein n=1 Tax=Vibrio tapetis subsp. tapetis TaxID=1671868 RepID=A0A2N8ZBR7_9VIBR|nr:hypothetical protein [Vibrio tapetis]SON49355.1 conserved protein of unknown function [Vibrio tapetis subsp. tapetis]